MSPPGDDGIEMPHGSAFDDGAIDAILGGATPDGEHESLASFVDDIRRAFGSVPPPNPAHAAALAAGVVSSPVTSAPHSEPSRHRLRRKLQGAVAGLGIAGKVLLGAGVAAAATAGAGAAGVLPGPMQNAVADAVGAVSPFDFPGGSGESHVQVAYNDDDDTTDVATTTTTTAAKEPKRRPKNDGGAVVVVPKSTTTTTAKPAADTTDETTPTTEKNHDDETMPTTEKKGDGNTTPTTKKETPKSTTTTEPDDPRPDSLSLSCVRRADPRKITCEWSESPSDDHYKFKLIRWDGAYESVVYYGTDGHRYVDFDVQRNKTYKYRVYSKDEHGNVVAYSERITLFCCGDG